MNVSVQLPLLASSTPWQISTLEMIHLKSQPTPKIYPHLIKIHTVQHIQKLIHNAFIMY